jgi:hypothetical protein
MAAPAASPTLPGKITDTDVAEAVFRVFGNLSPSAYEKTFNKLLRSGAERADLAVISIWVCRRQDQAADART